jgi:two-component system chemotaxis sensor kinase CheA
VGGAAAEAAGAEGPTGWSQTVRVNIDKLDRLMNTVGELTLVRNELAELQRELRQTEVDGGYHRRFQREMRTFGRRLDELQRGILEVRMVPLSQTFDKLARVVRRLSRDFEKQITFYVTGGGTEIDKLIVEELSDPLVHIIRNCIDHGVEDPVTRAALGKPAEGMVALRAFPRGNHVVIEVEDDGAGVDPDRLLGSAIERGFLTPETAVELTPREIMNLIFEPGFTTRGEVGPVSGRGVGMDVVKNNLARLSGLIDVFSELGQGTRFTLTLPITLAIIRALIVEVADQRYAIPLSTVLEIFPVRRAQLSTIEGREVVTLRGATLPLLRLEPVFGLQPPVRPAREGAGREYVVVVGMAQHRVGVLVDDLVGQQDIVIKSLGKSLSGVPGIAGATELGGRRTVLVLDIAALVDEFTAG